MTGAAAALLLAACGDDDADTTGGSETRTIEIEMRDIEFSPDEVQVDAGETVRFVFRNAGAVMHDAFIGDEAAQDEHEMEMQEANGGDDGMDHEAAEDDGEGGITVEPGETGELTHTFREGDELLIGCHQPGHYEAGMVVTVNVT
ncbi:MAG: plastocyanin/azurin family copper-binding protein [Acidimicrobiia bacterium]